MSTLSADQFGEQLEFPGMPPREQPLVAEQAKRFWDSQRGTRKPPYTSAIAMGGSWQRTKIPETPRSVLLGQIGGAGWKKTHTAEEEYVPTWQFTTTQQTVNPRAVEHQVKHANPMALSDDPIVFAWEDRRDLSGESQQRYHISDGNHRVSAALERGNLFIPANVYRDRRKR